MTQEQEGLEQGKDYKFSNAGTVSFQGKDSSGLNQFVPIKGQFSGETIKLTEYQVRILIRPNVTPQDKP